MEYVQFPGGGTYKSWIKLEEEAKRFLTTLTQYNSLIVIDDINNIHAKCVIVLDSEVTE